MSLLSQTDPGKVVFVNEYLRCRFGKWECVRPHFRRPPR
jgi:hypothetical protein